MQVYSGHTSYVDIEKFHHIKWEFRVMEGYRDVSSILYSADGPGLYFRSVEIETTNGSESITEITFFLDSSLC